MKIEDQVCSLELAKKLKDLGVKQESYFYWKHITKSLQGLKVYEDDRWVITDYGTRTGELNSEYHYSAFTVAELGEMLPSYLGEITECNFLQSEKVHVWGCAYKNWPVDLYFEADTEANARARMLQYLLEQGILRVNEINKKVGSDQGI